MSDVDVISVSAGSTDAAQGLSGDPTGGATELVAGADAQLGGAADPEKRIRDLQSAKDTATAHLTKAQREAQTYRQQAEAAESLRSTYADVLRQAVAFHLSHGQADPETALQWAQEDAEEHMKTLQEQTTIRQKAAKVDDMEKKAEAKAARSVLINEVLSETGLTREQLHAAVKGIDINASNVNELVWKAAHKAVKSLQQQQPNVQNRALVQELGFPAAGTSAQGLATLPAHPPEGMSRADPRWKAMVQAERNRLRGL